MTTSIIPEIPAEAYFFEVENPATVQIPSCDLDDPAPIQLATETASIPSCDGKSDAMTVSSNVLQQVLDLVNQERRRAGLPALRFQSQLAGAAQAHSNDMARNRFMGHRGSDGSSPFDRIRRYGYNFRAAGENVAAGHNSAQAVMSGWMNSSGHRKNILNPNFRDIGIGYARSDRPYWTQTFGS